MSEQSIRLFGAPPPLSARERGEVAGEVARLRALLATVPGAVRVRVAANPSGPLGTYAWLLLEATARGVAPAELLPPAIRRRYDRRRWFAHCVAALLSSIEQIQAAEDAAAGDRSAGT